MSLYNGVQRTGPLRTRIKRAELENMARRFMRAKLPRTADDTFAKLRKIGQRKGFALPLPAIAFDYKGSKGSTAISALQAQLLRAPDFVTKQAKSTPGTPLQKLLAAPNLAGAAAQGAFTYASDFKTEWVDDRNWGAGRTLPEILGSKMLTPDMLAKLNINNILSMFRFEGGTEAERVEMGFVLQRFALEGYIRGVDVIAHLEADNAANGRTCLIKLGSTEEMTYGTNPDGTPMVGAGLSWGDPTNQVYFLGDFWRGLSDQSKVAVFFHEFGHQLVDWGDSDYFYGIKGTFDSDVTKSDEYFGHLFAEGPKGSGQNWDYKIPATQSDLTTPPGGFPQVGGTDVGDTTGTNTTGTNVTTNTNVTVNDITNQQPVITPSNITGTNIGSRKPGVPSQGNTPVAGMLAPNISFDTFRAGLADILGRRSEPLGAYGGSIQKLKRGAA